MIPTVRHLLLALDFARKRGKWTRLPSHDDLIEGLSDAHLEAMRLADGGVDECAALFFACAARRPALGEAVMECVTLVTLNQARLRGREMGAGDPGMEMVAKAREIATGALDLEGFCAWFDEQHPVG